MCARAGDGVGTVIECLRHPGEQLRNGVNTVLLVLMTGQDFHGDTEAWQRWWRANRQDLVLTDG